jgi:hypothetical protein
MALERRASLSIEPEKDEKHQAEVCNIAISRRHHCFDDHTAILIFNNYEYLNE